MLPSVDKQMPSLSAQAKVAVAVLVQPICSLLSSPPGNVDLVDKIEFIWPLIYLPGYMQFRYITLMERNRNEQETQY